MKKDYIIWSPAFSSSNGVRVLHILSEQLIKKGYNAYLYAGEPHNTKYNYITEITDDLRKNAIIIYPEVVKGNPLKFQNVVRFVLFYPGKLGGNKKYHKSETLFTYLKDFYPTAPVLTVPGIDQSLFYNDNSPKTQDCYFVYKGGKSRNAQETEGLVEINMKYPETRQELANLLRTTGTLYSYDNNTAMLDEASLCGANVKIITPEGIEDFQSTYSNYTDNFEEQLDAFIKLTQKISYNGKIENKLYINPAKFIRNYVMFFLHKYIIKNEAKITKFKNRIRGF